MFKKPGLIATALIFVFIAGKTNAGMLQIDEYRYEFPPGSDAFLVNGTIDATVSGYVLTLKVTNTTQGFTTNTSNNLLTALGLTLPNFTPNPDYPSNPNAPQFLPTLITGGTVHALDGTEQHFVLDPDGTGDINISKEWGYMQPVSGGHLAMTLEDNDTGNIYLSPFTYGLAVSTMTADSFPPHGTPFAEGSIGNPANHDGPDFGVYSLLNDPFYVTGDGQPAVGGYVTIRLTLDEYIAAGDADAFIAGINQNAVSLVFGSADNAFIPDNLVSVPEPASLALLGLTCLGGLGLRFRRQRDAKQVAA